eukprot:2129762-Prymnesium_polylepis.1
MDSSQPTTPRGRPMTAPSDTRRFRNSFKLGAVPGGGMAAVREMRGAGSETEEGLSMPFSHTSQVESTCEARRALGLEHPARQPWDRVHSRRSRASRSAPAPCRGCRDGRLSPSLPMPAAHLHADEPTGQAQRGGAQPGQGEGQPGRPQALSLIHI